MTTRPFTPLGIEHVVFLIDDMPKALASALIVLWDISHPGAKNVVPPVKGGRNVDHIAIMTGPFEPDALRTYMAAKGVEIVHEAFHGGARGMGDSFYIRDPFGNKLEIKGPAPYPDGTASDARLAAFVVAAQGETPE